MFSRAIRHTASISKNQHVAAVRMLHEVPVLKNHETFAKNGIQGLYSAEGYATAWSDYQKLLTTSLTLNTVGTRHEGRSAFQLLLLTAKRTTDQHIFHYASQAHNNHMFFEQLADKEHAASTRPSRFLLERIAGGSSLDSLKTEIIRLAESAEGQGWVFLVEDPDKSFRLLKCNNDGTPYYHGKNQSLDLNANIDPQSFEELTQIKQKGDNAELDFTLPVLAINFWDVAFVTDYGITGKREYLERVLDHINWDVINKRMFQV
ncbi:hypothetical protein METBIDRAFT_102810 [Metschnikowia bicuspidata var. bicuspidata NRRL YB-4993]|uniref:Manganese/iron superoxide dismutase C-terminal domain-containing protein n=1 Tax=Metschnikowia bicuspidata var. bicuspidata NRRL YB-4993 TaxID=869754 RepID=A0A1A0HHD6_9ASCO|nr:hypothetical protein METBIDRAFT_102810 [Metschnikowia bicuspidata var. bicuspidata NRRL YB-4993]OBA23253.1 hypothetical protein METBIDRAFT_102810 [Metschnikowia bicuspidata var. bicuspidata NRRL YB-4993]